jgi:hypothetical protein
MKIIIFNRIFAVVAISLLTACNTAKVQSWADPQFAGRPIGKTIVLGVAESDSRCRQYEDLFVSRLLELGIAASSLHANSQLTDKLDREGLKSLLELNEVDSIIVTRVLSETERNQMVETGYYGTAYTTYWGYYDYGYTVSYNTADVTSFMEFELETNLYDVETEKLVWSGRNVVYDDRSDMKNMQVIIRGVVRDLRKQGFIE